MRSILRRLFGDRSGRRSTVTCYLRENGPIAYELDVFASAPRERTDAMMSSELVWAWKSGAREWTHLTRISLSAVLADISTGVLLIATEGELPTTMTAAEIANWLRRFSRLQPVPVVAVVSVTGDRQLLFVQQHAPQTVNSLLDGWRVDKGAAIRQAYARLGPASLESIADRLEAGSR